jgi:ABC-2 type transport system ATP-binding protein
LDIDKLDIAVCPDVPEFEPWLTAFEIMQLAANLTGRAGSDDKLHGLLDNAGLGESSNRKVGGFSRGMTQRLALATTFVGNPKIVILDEPCSALDPSGRVEVLDTIARMGKNSTIIFSTHILADVQRVCDQVGVLDKGAMLYQGSLDAFLQKNTQPIWNVTLRGGTEKVRAALSKSEWVTHTKELSKTKLQVVGTSIDAVERQLIHVLAAANAQVISVEPVDNDLEHAFLRLTNADHKDNI